MPYDIRAYLALLLFVPLSIALLVSFRRPLTGILAVFFGGILFLPEHAAFDFPFLPPMDKNGFAAVLAFAGALMFERRRLNSVRMLGGVELFFLLIVIGNVGTALTNDDTLYYGRDIFRRGMMVGQQKVLAAITPYDILSMTIRDVIGVLLPFHLGRALIRSGADLRLLFRVLAVLGLVYVPLILYEVRMSPQLHNTLYGYMANKFSHAMRGDGFKPTVFLNNGLAVAMFVLTALLCTMGLSRARERVGPAPSGLAALVLWVTLLLSRNVGANVYAAIALPVAVITRGRLGNRIATVLLMLVLSYPVLRAADLIPTREIITAIEPLSPERAQSLNFRFVNEDALLEKARERIWFGWGGFGRNRLYDEYGKDASVTDGEWIIRLGGRGIVGFVGSFALLLIPILVARRRLVLLAPGPDRYGLDIFSLMVGLIVVDLLPNGMFTQMPFFLAGALAGAAQGLDPARRTR